MGWTDNHLHRFEIGDLDYGLIDPEEDDSSQRTFGSDAVRLHDFALRYGLPVEFLYGYDFGDSWVHFLTLNSGHRDPASSYLRCTGGSRDGPHEESGRAPGYAEFLEALRTPTHPGAYAQTHPKVRYSICKAVTRRSGQSANVLAKFWKATPDLVPPA